MIAVLAGGVGAARFLRGLVRVVPPEEITVISNTGDDIRIYGVHVSPDVDIVTYMLAGIFDEERQFGIRGDTHALMDELVAQGREAWFALGDRDFAVCLARTLWLAEGVPPSECATRIGRRFGVRARILPMTDDEVWTAVRVRETAQTEREIHFQEYWVRRRAADPAVSVRLVGAERARPAPGVLAAIRDAEAVLVAPSNPVVSIGTILAVPGVREALRATPAPRIAVSPIVAGRVVRGMADRLLPAVGAEVSAAGVAGLYRDFLHGMVIDSADAARADEIGALGIEPEVAQTMMHTPEDAAGLAKSTLSFAERVRR